MRSLTPIDLAQLLSGAGPSDDTRDVTIPEDVAAYTLLELNARFNAPEPLFKEGQLITGIKGQCHDKDLVGIPVVVLDVVDLSELDVTKVKSFMRTAYLQVGYHDRRGELTVAMLPAYMFEVYTGKVFKPE